MSEVDLVLIRKRHHKVHYGDPAYFEEKYICEECQTGDISEHPSHFWPCDVIQMAEEIERLRKALEKIRDEKVSNLSVSFWMRDIAFAALHTADSRSPAGNPQPK